MKQKQKIILFLSSFLSGIPIIFFSLKDNQVKNNLTIKKKENKLMINNENQQEKSKSSSFLFWIVFIIILFVVLIIFWIIYRSLFKKETDNQDKNINPNIPNKQNNINNNFLNPPQLTINNNNIKNNIDNLNNPSNVSSAPPIINCLFNPEKYKNYVCGLQIVDDKRIEVIFCPKWDKNDADAFFEKLWTLDVINVQNEYKSFYQDFNKPEIKDEIKKFFNLMINILQMVTFPLLKEILSENKKFDFSKLSIMGKNINENKNILYPISIADALLSFQNDNIFKKVLLNNDHLSCFKRAMQSEDLLFLNHDEDAFFKYFSNLYFFIKQLRQELHNFLCPKEDNEHQQLWQNLDKYGTAIKNFLKIKIN